MKGNTADGRRATAILLAINLLRRRLRDGEQVQYRAELLFYAFDLDVPIEQLRAMAELETTPVEF